MTLPRPNWFLVGAPKCGTTSLCEYIGAHPNGFVCRPKETHYFATDMPNYRFVQNEGDYLRCFRRAGSATAIGEGSVWYLHSEEALWNIRAFAPDARIIVILRDPVEMIRSLHAHLLRDMCEDEPDLGAAWQKLPARRAGREIPSICRMRFHPRVLLYDEIASYGRQMQKLLGIFPRE